MSETMRKLWTITKREYLERVRSRWFVIATVFGPLLFGGIMFLPAFFAMRTRASENVTRIQVLDATGTTLGTRVAAELAGGPMGDTSLTRVLRVEPAGLAEAESLALLRTRSVRSVSALFSFLTSSLCFFYQTFAEKRWLACTLDLRFPLTTSTAATVTAPAIATT